MLKFIKKSFIQYVPASLQQPLKRVFIWPLRRLIQLVKDMWLPIYRIERSGLTVILIGHEACTPYLIHLLYGEFLDPLRIGIVPIWSLNCVIRRWEKKADFIIFRDRKFRPAEAVARCMLTMPYYVEQYVHLPPPDADLLAAFRNSSTKEDLRRIRNGEFEYEVTQDPAQLEFFYHQMHLPFIQDRHSEAAEILSWEIFRQYYANTELLLIRKAGQLVAGSLNLQTGDSYALYLGGILNADKELIKAGTIAACYWFSIAEARRRGCTTVNLQCSRPCLKNGVLAYKKKWGGRIVMSHKEPELGLLPCGNRLAMYRFLEENPFICERNGRLVSLIFLGSHVLLNDAELSSYLRECHYQGDQLSTCVVLLNNEWAARSETIQNILSELSSPSRVVNLSHGSLMELPELISNWQDQSHGSATEFSKLAYAQ